MKKVLMLLGALCAIVSIDVYSENITIEENMVWGNSYYVDGKRMESWFLREELRKVMISNPEAVKELDSSIAYGMSSTLMLVSGVIMVGEQLVDVVAGNDPSATIAVAGTGFVYLGMWLREKTQQKYKKAIDIFNSGVGGGIEGEREINTPGITPGIRKRSRNNFQFDVSPRLVSLSLSFY